MHRDPKTGRVTRRPIIAGERYGRLTTIERIPGTRNVRCICDCGNEKTVQICNLRHSDPKKSIRSCGCLQKEYLYSARSNGQYVGGKPSPLAVCYQGMLSRCQNPKSTSYSAYGGRGISVCERWQGPNGLANFCMDMGERPKGHTLDRIDVNADYSPENCRWADRKTQTNNRRPYTLITIEELERLRALAAKAEGL